MATRFTILALRPDALTAQSRIFVEIARWQKHAASAGSETGATPTLPRARKKKGMAKKPEAASPFVATGEGASPERGGDSKNARSRFTAEKRGFSLAIEEAVAGGAR